MLEKYCEKPDIEPKELCKPLDVEARTQEPWHAIGTAGSILALSSVACSGVIETTDFNSRITGMLAGGLGGLVGTSALGKILKEGAEESFSDDGLEKAKGNFKLGCALFPTLGGAVLGFLSPSAGYFIGVSGVGILAATVFSNASRSAEPIREEWTDEKR